MSRHINCRENISMKWTHWILLILVVATFSSLASVNAQESTLEPKPVPTLDATYTSDNGRIAISYPKNWAQTVYKDATTEPGLNIRISNNADTLKYFGALNKTFPSGDVIITITVYERYWLGVADKGLDATLDILTLRKTL